MIIKNTKTNWSYILIVFIFAVIAGGVALLSQQIWLPEELAILKLPVMQKATAKPKPKPITLPTEINQNFLAQVNECFIPTAKIYGYTLRITSGFRDIDEQDVIYDLGRTEEGHIVSWSEPGKSIHNYGYAVDVVDRWRGYDINWERLAKIGEFCGLAQIDDAHFEYRGGLITDQFIAGAKPMALLTLPCDIMSERSKANQPLTLKDLQSCGAPNFWNSI